jgi:hypothetical protein
VFNELAVVAGLQMCLSIQVMLKERWKKSSLPITLLFVNVSVSTVCLSSSKTHVVYY